MKKTYCKSCGNLITYDRKFLMKFLETAYNVNGELYCWDCMIPLTRKNQEKFLKSKEEK